MTNKKAIAPLIATVILVGFAVSLAALVIDWNLGYYEDIQDKTDTETRTRLDCTVDLDLRLASIRGVQQICYNNQTGNIELTLENANPEQIDDVKIRVITNQSVFGPSVLKSVSGGNVTTIIGGGAVKAIFNITFDEEIEEVTIIPGLDIDGEIRLCANQLINIDGPLNDCDLI